MNKFKFKFSLKFEANPEIEADTLEEAEAKAWEMMKDVRVVRDVQLPLKDRRGATIGVSLVQKDAEEYVRMEPCCLEEAEGLVCRKCGHQLTRKNVTSGYQFYCPNCDEDMYGIEARRR